MMKQQQMGMIPEMPEDMEGMGGMN